MLLSLVFGCGKDKKKMGSAPRNEHGLALPQTQIDSSIKGKDTITISEEMRYPGMVQYDNAKYEFTSEDTPETIGEWFLSNLKGSFKNNKGDGSEWIIIYNDVIINIVPFGSGGSLLRYKTNI